MKNIKLKKVAVIGSGIMGSRIACHLVNVGMDVLLLDICPKELNKKELIKKNNKIKHYFFVSNYTKEFEKSAKFFFKEDLKLEEVSLL